MTDHDGTSAGQGSTAETPELDDDRLLAFALGLDDDPGLRTAAEGDAALRERLEAVRADVAAVGAGLDRVVPAPPDDYADLDDPRWKKLHKLVPAPAAPAARRRPFWVRALAPALAIGLVLLAGVVGVQYLDRGGDGTAELSTSGAADKAGGGRDDESTLQGGPASGAAEGMNGAVAGLVPGAPDPSAYATVLVARARTPGDSRQRFDVVRVLRGDAREYEEGAVVTLDLVGEAVAPERLVVLYLTPTPTPTPGATASATVGATPQPPGPAPETVTYGYRGGDALVLQLPADVDPDALALP